MSDSTPSKTSRACDYCRRKKARCNGHEIPGGRCLTCIRYSVECTYEIPPKARATKAYVKSLEDRLVLLEGIIREYLPRESLPSGSMDTRRDAGDAVSEDDEDDQPKLAPLPMRAYAKRPHGDPLSFPDDSSSNGDSSTESWLHSAQSVDFQETLSPRFHGESSLLAFTNTLSEKWKFTNRYDLRSRRREFWETPQWMLPLMHSPPPHFEFPEMDLMLHLVDCYFENFNVILPILHRPSFVRSIKEGLHKVDEHFGAALLTVCAIGCRCTKDPRVVHEVKTSLSCTAWKLFNQISANRSCKIAFLATSVYKAQLYPLTALFLERYCPPSTVWMVIGFGLRMMQENGAHRKTFSANTVLEKELWKRAFWVLVVLDRYFATILGRACGLRDEDFDAELPLRCDDADLGESGLKSPLATNPPTQMCSFLAAIKLSRILAFALRTLYSTKQSRVILGYIGKHWEQHIITALDSALNKWTDDVPEHLRWGSEASKKHKPYLLQSAFLWCQFYETQLLVHRTIALGNHANPERSAASMIMCKNAARRCIETVEFVDDALSSLLSSYLFAKSIFASSIFLHLMFRRSGLPNHDSPEYRATKASRVVIERTSERWRVSACMLYILDVLQGTDDGTFTCMGRRVEEWYRPRLGTFLSVDSDGVPCHAEYSGIAPIGQPPELGCEVMVNGSGPLSASTDPLTHNDLTAGVFWQDLEKGARSGEHARQTFGTAERELDYGFYDNFLNQISDLSEHQSA